MTLICEYCQSPCAAGLLKCPNCSAPLNARAEAGVDYRHCPFCRRMLLALGSPACNYCGRRLPEEYIKAREGDLQRLTELDGHTPDPQLTAKLDTILRQTARRDRHRSPLADLFSISIGDPSDPFS
jgi:Zn-finger nucleic acid-binding protein